MADTIQPIYHNFDLGFDTEDEKRVSIKQDSDETHILVLTLYTNDDVMTISPTWDYHITMRKPDGRLIVDTSNIEIKNNKVYITCTAQMLSAPGTSKCELVIYNNSQSLYSNNFYIYVTNDLITGDEIESTDEFNSLVDALRLVQSYEQLAKASKDSAAESEASAKTSAENASEYEAQIRAILDSLDGYDDTVTNLIQELTTKSSEIDNLKTSIQDSADDINSLLSKLEDMGLDQLEQLVTNSRNLYDNMVTLNDDCVQLKSSISEASTSVNQMVDDLTTKYEDADEKYSTFVSQFQELSAKMDEADTFLNSLEQMKTQIEADKNQIALNKTQSAADYNSIQTMKSQIEDILNELREEQESGVGKYDPIIISATQPGQDVQTTDDMWLEPYGIEESNSSSNTP